MPSGNRTNIWVQKGQDVEYERKREDVNYKEIIQLAKKYKLQTVIRKEQALFRIWEA